MAPKKKKNKLLVKLISGAGTGFFYLFKKTPAIAQKKLALRKFDPIVNQYVIFNEAKLKFSTTIAQPELPKVMVDMPQPMLVSRVFATMWAIGRCAAKPALYGAGLYGAWALFGRDYWNTLDRLNSKGYAYSPEQFPRLVNNQIVLPPVVEEKVAIVPGPLVRSVLISAARHYRPTSTTPTTTKLPLIRDFTPQPTPYDCMAVNTKTTVDLEKV